MAIGWLAVFLIGGSRQVFAKRNYVVHWREAVEGPYGHIKRKQKSNIETCGEKTDFLCFVFDIRCYQAPVKIYVDTAHNHK